MLRDVLGLSWEDLTAWAPFMCLGVDITSAPSLTPAAWAGGTEGLDSDGTVAGAPIRGLSTWLRLLPVGRLGYERESPKNKHLKRSKLKLHGFL